MQNIYLSLLDTLHNLQNVLVPFPSHELNTYYAQCINPDDLIHLLKTTLEF